MKVHEYQAKRILAKFGMTIPRGEVAYNPAGAYEISKQLGGTVVVKAQIHAGGRGEAGGIKIAKTPEAARDIANEMIGKILVTPQTGPEGRHVRSVLIEETVNILKEIYLGIVIDRSAQKAVFIASRVGGVEIEKTAEESPELITKEYIDPGQGFLPFQTRRLGFALGLPKELVTKASVLMTAMYNAFHHTDASLVEINPFVLTAEKEMYALDAKINFDDNALYRHTELTELRDLNEEDPLEVKASQYGLNYIKLEGDIGCMVNGAGLAMATMDMVQLAGGKPANFLDVGGGASRDQVKHAFEILLSDKNIRSVLINIFGGIMRCDVLAEGLIEAAKSLGVKVPIVIRLEGTNVEKGRELLKESGLQFLVASDMKEAASKAAACTARR